MVKLGKFPPPWNHRTWKFYLFARKIFSAIKKWKYNSDTLLTKYAVEITTTYYHKLHYMTCLNLFYNKFSWYALKFIP